MPLDPQERKRVMISSEVAEYLRVSLSTIKKKTATGEIPSFPVGRARRYLRDLIDQYTLKDMRYRGPDEQT